MEILNLIFKEYWSQIIMIFGAIGYLIKVKSDRNSKKIEIKTKLFFEKKFAKYEELNKSLMEILDSFPSSNTEPLIIGRKLDEGDFVHRDTYPNLNNIIRETIAYLNTKERLELEKIIELLKQIKQANEKYMVFLLASKNKANSPKKINPLKHKEILLNLIAEAKIQLLRFNSEFTSAYLKN